MSPLLGVMVEWAEMYPLPDKCAYKSGEAYQVLYVYTDADGVPLLLLSVGGRITAVFATNWKLVDGAQEKTS